MEKGPQKRVGKLAGNLRSELAVPARRAALLARSPLPPPPPLEKPAEATVDVAAAFADTLSRIRPMSAAEGRAMILRESIFPRLETWGFPARYRVEIEAWNCAPQERVFAKCREMFRGVGAIVALVGERGTGKTVIAAQLALRIAWSEREDFMRGGPCAPRFAPYRKLSDLVARFKALYADFGMLDAEVLMGARDTICGADFLAIDEVHECDDLRVKDLLLTDLIDRRYSARRDTLLVSNQTVVQFRDSTSDSILSRISEHGVIVPCEWPSWRPRLAARKPPGSPAE